MIGPLRARRSWRDHRFAVLDLEATGPDFQQDHVLSFGVVPVEHDETSGGLRGGRVDSPERVILSVPVGEGELRSGVHAPTLRCREPSGQPPDVNPDEPGRRTTPSSHPFG